MMPEIAIRKPFSFNLLKHHKIFVSALLERFREEDLAKLKNIMDKGGNLWCDYYHGSLSPDIITGEIEEILIHRALFQKQAFCSWIQKAPRRFRSVKLSDGSEWILLPGKHSDRYIHIHPARYSEFTVRVRLVALKTAMLARLFYGDIIGKLDYEKINFIREKFLNAPPLKFGGDVSHLKKVDALISS